VNFPGYSNDVVQGELQEWGEFAVSSPLFNKSGEFVVRALFLDPINSICLFIPLNQSEVMVLQAGIIWWLVIIVYYWLCAGNVKKNAAANDFQ